MIRLSPSKINLGLLITGKRGDGFHELQSIMIPVPFYDLIEIKTIPDETGKLSFTQTGINPDVPLTENLCVKAFNLFSKHHPTEAVKIHLHKQIPVGAGLGGGSSNATSILEMLNEKSGTPFTLEELGKMAAELGSDCPFFLHHMPMLMEGRGEILSKTDVDLSELYAVILNPGIKISTASAFKLVSPAEPDTTLSARIMKSRSEWPDIIRNDFEAPLFIKFPELKALKDNLYSHGAIYASMSGSGSSVYGLFKERPSLSSEIETKKIWEGDLESLKQIL